LPPGKAENQEVSLRPNAGVVPTGKQLETGTKTWGGKVNPAQNSGIIFIQNL